MSSWKEYKLGDVAEIIGGGTPSTSNNEFWNGNIPWLTPRDLTGYSKVYISHGERFITESGLKNSSAKLMPKGSVLLTSRAPIGYVVIAENEICTNQGFKSLVPNFEILNSEFLYYWLKANTDYLQQLGTGTTFTEISGSVVKNIDISLPPLEEQKAIAEILSSLDDKIDLLHRQNQTLESLAQTLFRQWFIEEVKEEWEIKFSDAPIQIIDGDRGNNYPKNSDFFTNEYCLFLSARNVTKNGFDFSDCQFITKERDELLRKGKLSRNDVVLTTRGTVGNIAYYHELIPFENIRINSGMVILRADETKISPLYLYILMKSPLFCESVIEHTSGSAQPQLPIRDLNNVSFILPPKNIYYKFMEQVKPIYSKVFNNQKQIQTLEKLRDTLLPKLLSGEVRIVL
ncbi:restriction endonuclease subunit S [Aliarcobacter butzleri]|uniref:restriction endonuclease subunit S n=1 Tax=Aliarcobacter butzleri TaxID=28197 RepID=UPI00125EB400|nr:restriction endonuclease subunit S [Aliarcobacter butzleri]